MISRLLRSRSKTRMLPKTLTYSHRSTDAFLFQQESTHPLHPQLGGSFKLRGVLNKLLLLSEDQRKLGVVAVSGGNHAIATALAAKQFGIPAVVLMPQSSAAFNVEAARSAGADVELLPDAAAAFKRADHYIAQGRVHLHGYDDPEIIAGNGTVGLEFAKEVSSRLSHVFVSIGGGGFCCGVATGLHLVRKDIVVHGIETVGAETLTQALAANAPVTIQPTSIARTLCAPFATQRTLQGVRQLISEITVVPDSEAVAGMRLFLEHEKILVEPAAGCTIAGAARLAPLLPKDAVLGLVICGSNVAVVDAITLFERFKKPETRAA